MKANRKTANWIFLRGLTREAEHWGTFPVEFEKRFDAHVITLDLPGNGEYFGVPTPLTLKGLVEFVRAKWQEKNPAPGEPVNVLALSLGAMVALQWMQSYPGEIRAAVFVNTSLRGVSPVFKRMSPSVYATMARIFLDGSAVSREARILRLTSQHREWSRDELQRRADIQRRHPVGKVNAFRQMIAALSTVERSKKPEQPTLILNSLGDQLVHPDCSKAIARAWKVPIKRHAWAGHDLPLDDPQWTLQAIEEWLISEGLLPQPSSDQKPAKSE